MTKLRSLLVSVVAVSVLTACGGGGDDTADSASGAAGSEATTATSGSDTGTSGDATGPGTDVRAGDFELLPTRPEEGYDDVAGTATLERHVDGTTLTFDMTGLPADTDFLAHVHEGPCSENGGPHYKFDPAGGDNPPNEIHLHFSSDGEGAASAAADNPDVAGEEAITAVVHPAAAPDQPFACATFEQS